MRLNRATKIVATLGPASSDREVLKQMLLAGVDVVRLNFSHGVAEDHRQRANLIRSLSKEIDREIAIMADLQGPKIRVGKFLNGKIQLEQGHEFILDADCKMGDEQRVGLDYKDLPKDVHPGDLLLLNDGLIVLKVQKVVGVCIHTLVEMGGELSNNKGINRAGGGLTAPALTEKDKQDLVTAIEMDVDYIAISFPKNAADMQYARSLANEAAKPLNKEIRLIAKIERAEAIMPGVLEGIIDASDGIMVARGDLAVEVGNAAVPALQKRMILLANKQDKFVITATQMMESMINSPIPTRAEVSDVANAVLDGTDAVMLSAETAAGQYPIKTVEQMAAICLEAEKSQQVSLDADFLDQTFTRIDQSIALGALFTSFHLKVKAIAALTESGSTVLWMSRHKIDIPIFALTQQVKTQRALSMYRNVIPLRLEISSNRDVALHQVEHLLCSKGVVQSGDMVTLTIGEPMGQPGGTNTLKIIKVK
ncbi:pyruvate kinase [Polynucleobacter kasalickyi]|uniref:Pyruvate kinase n=1 Tax=Polynucleobacter kasalickyi TaxID=1938817 RepID=A0A1W1YJP3_9BURK|nr:pyruvate kinase [Polynucleobacter kasalickyi]SMC36399.1 pyruvate kinase [Polynucleobacter kasalickyi]